MNRRNTTGIVLGFVGCLINIYLAGKNVGFRQGYEYFLDFVQKSNGFTISGGYDVFLEETHFLLTLCFILFTAGLHINKQVIRIMMGLLPLLVAIFCYIRWIGLMVQNSEFTFFENVNNTATILDGVSIALILVLALLHVVSFLESRSRSPDRTEL